MLETNTCVWTVMRAHPAGERPSSQDLGRHLNDTREGATPTGPGAASQARGQQCEGPGPGWAWRARARGRAEDRGRGETLSGLCCHTKHGAGLAGRRGRAGAGAGRGPGLGRGRSLTAGGRGPVRDPMQGPHPRGFRTGWMRVLQGNARCAVWEQSGDWGAAPAGPLKATFYTVDSKKTSRRSEGTSAPPLSAAL